MTKILSDNASLRWRQEQRVTLYTSFNRDRVLLFLFAFWFYFFLAQSDRVHY